MMNEISRFARNDKSVIQYIFQIKSKRANMQICPKNIWCETETFKFFFKTSKVYPQNLYPKIVYKQNLMDNISARIDYIELENTLKIAIKQTFVYIQDIIGSETLYAFGIYTTDEATYIYPTANTEEGLTRQIEKNYLKKTNQLEEMRKMIRWSPCDWDYHLSGKKIFHGIEEILLKGWEKDFSDYKCDAVRVHKICIDALKELRSEIEDDSLILNLMMGDQSDEERIENASKLNTQHKVEELKKELEEGFQIWTKTFPCAKE